MRIPGKLYCIFQLLVGFGGPRDVGQKGDVRALLTKLSAVIAEIADACLKRATHFDSFLINKGLILDSDKVAILFMFGGLCLRSGLMGR